MNITTVWAFWFKHALLPTSHILGNPCESQMEQPKEKKQKPGEDCLGWKDSVWRVICRCRISGTAVGLGLSGYSYWLYRRTPPNKTGDRRLDLAMCIGFGLLGLYRGFIYWWLLFTTKKSIEHQSPCLYTLQWLSILPFVKLHIPHLLYLQRQCASSLEQGGNPSVQGTSAELLSGRKIPRIVRFQILRVSFAPARLNQGSRWDQERVIHDREKGTNPYPSLLLQKTLLHLRNIGHKW